MRGKFPGAKLVLSSIAPREDNKTIQRNVQFLNAAVNRKYGGEKDIYVVDNTAIQGPTFKKDGIHLLDDGTSMLARHIRDGVKAILNINK